jgi:riboflavin synthase
MFTGIVEEVGTLRGIRPGSNSFVLDVAATTITGDAAVGDSILTDGVCLTVTSVRPGGFAADAMPETVRRTTLSERRPGDSLNLERAMTLSSRLGGHLVSGHVDGVGAVTSVSPEDNALVVEIEAPEAVARVTVDQGSVAVDGVSLTVIAVAGDRVRVSLIPHTATVTTLGRLKAGSRVNLEADLIAKYVYAFVAGRKPDGGLTWEKLAEAGF